MEVSSGPLGPVMHPAWGPRGLSTHPVQAPSLALSLSPSPYSKGLSGCRGHLGLSVSSSSESTRSYRRGGRSLEDCPSARQPLPRRNMPVRLRDCGLKGGERVRGRQSWSRVSVLGRQTSVQDWGQPSFAQSLFCCSSFPSPGWVQLGRAQALRGGRDDKAQALTVPQRRVSKAVSARLVAQRRKHSLQTRKD